MKTLQDYVAAYGSEAGPKLHRTLLSRAAYKGVSTRRRHRIEALTGKPFRARRRRPLAAAVNQTQLPFGPVATGQDPSGSVVSPTPFD